MESIDVLVVGAGPAGTTAAFELARAGHSVLVVEEHPCVGRPVQCAGLVSQRVLDLAGSSATVVRPVRGASVFGPSLKSIDFRAESPRAFVIDRGALDVQLADRAARAGAEIRTGVRFDGVAPNGGDAVAVRLTPAGGTPYVVQSRLVIGADGVASAVARAFRLRRPVEILPAFEAEFPVSPGDPEIVEVYLGRRIAPGLFGWWIPDGRGGARVGVASNPDGTPARAYFLRLVEHLSRRFGARLGNPTALIASGIPIGVVPRICADHVLLIGDAAAQVKPLSGGGIFTGMVAARIAAGVVGAALGANDLSERRLSSYAKEFDRELGEEFRRALYLRRLFARLSDPELDALIDALGGAGFSGMIVAFGDIDFPTHVVRSLLRESPGLLRLLPKALGAWVSPGGAYPAPELDLAPRRK